MSLSLTDVPGVGPTTAKLLTANGVKSVKKLARIDLDELLRVPGMGEITGRRVIAAAKDLRAAKKSDKKEKKKNKRNKKQEKKRKQEPGKREKSNRKDKGGKDKKKKRKT